MSADVAIIDNGGANIASLLCAFERLGKTATLTKDADTIRAATRVLLPGVGAAREAMQRLHDHKLVDVIRNLEQPVLGICLGMQLLADGSEEEDVDCLGVIPGVAEKLSAQPSMPVPNMGWSQIELQKPHALTRDIEDGDYFYFLHSFALPVSKHTLATAAHNDSFSAIIGRDNFVAAQFHPERSSTAGSRMLASFLDISL